MQTTNAKLEQVLSEIDTLIGWAEADAQHSRENDAFNQARNDELRVGFLRQAKTILEGCGR